MEMVRVVSSAHRLRVCTTERPHVCFLLGCDDQSKSLSLSDGDPGLNLPVLVTDQCRHTPALKDVRAAAMKPDKMEETLTCIICQDLLHDCVRCVSTRKASVGSPTGNIVGSIPLGQVGPGH